MFKNIQTYSILDQSNQCFIGRASKQHTLRKLCFCFLSNWVGYDPGDSFPFYLGLNRKQFGSIWKEMENGNLVFWFNSIWFNLKGNGKFIPFNLKGNGNTFFSTYE